MRWMLGIDPGTNGGIARLSDDGRVDAWRMPKGGLEAISDLLRALGSRSGCEKVVLERVWGRESDSKRAMTTFMRHVGFLVGCIYSSFENPSSVLLEVPPTKWQTAIGCPKAPSKAEEPKAHRRKTIHKNALKEMAERLFPEVENVTLATADALLLLEYARRECYSWNAPREKTQ